MYLVGDIGGTKTLLELGTFEGEAWRPQGGARFMTRDFSSLEEILQAFLPAGIRLQAVCLGVAGPVIGGRSKLTHLLWTVEEEALSKFLGGARVKLLNDLEAAGWALISNADFGSAGSSRAESVREVGSVVAGIRTFTLQEGEGKGNRAVIAAGTGLGEAQLLRLDSPIRQGGRIGVSKIRQGGRIGEAEPSRIRQGGQICGTFDYVLPTEGGHCDFAPTTREQVALLQWFWREGRKRVSFDDILSGRGLKQLYRFFLAQEGQPPPPEFKVLEDWAPEISRRALEGEDPYAENALRLWCEIYGAEGGNLVLKSLALGGLFIAGGMAPKVLPYLKRYFLKGFLNRGRFRDLLAKVPVWVVLEEDLVLKGAKTWLLRKEVQP